MSSKALPTQVNTNTRYSRYLLWILLISCSNVFYHLVIQCRHRKYFFFKSNLNFPYLHLIGNPLFLVVWDKENRIAWSICSLPFGFFSCLLFSRQSCCFTPFIYVFSPYPSPLLFFPLLWTFLHQQSSFWSGIASIPHRIPHKVIPLICIIIQYFFRLFPTLLLMHPNIILTDLTTVTQWEEASNKLVTVMPRNFPKLIQLI